MTNGKTSELHLIVLWEKARVKEKQIIADITERLAIRQIFDITWTPSLVASNFSRFYGQKLPPHSGKEKSAGTGPFLCVVVEDKAPRYQFVETSRGHEWVNVNIFELKTKYRAWASGCSIHTTNSVQETNHDATLMLGLNYEDLQRSLPKRWDGSSQKIHRDVIGATGWKSLSELFYTLNSTINYVVLRGTDIIKDCRKSATIGDIDVFTSDYANCKLIVNGLPAVNESRPHFLVCINGIKVYIDVWNSDNKYYDARWSENMLDTRQLSADKVYKLSPENQFYEFIYHCLIHKKELRKDYDTTAHALFVKLGLDKKYDITQYDSPFDLYFELLKNFMAHNHYAFVKPVDPTVFFSDKLMNYPRIIAALEKNYHMKGLTPIQTQLVNGNNQIFFKGMWGDKKVFVKVGTHKDIYKNEYQMTDALHKADPQHFVTPLLYSEKDEMPFVATEYLKGVSLNDYLKTNPSPKTKAGLIEDLFQIFTTLKASKIMHRDIRPANLLVVGNQLKLIDCQLAVYKADYKELDYLEKTRLWRWLGETYAVAQGIWDDAYSLLKVLEYIGCEPSYQKRYEHIHTAIADYVGHDRISRVSMASPWNIIGYRFKSILCRDKQKRHEYRRKYKSLKKAFKFRSTVKYYNGHREVYILGVKAYSYQQKKKA